MALLELQGVLARLYVDAAFRAEFFERTHATPLPPSLTEADRRLLAGLDRRQVDRFARSLRGKRFGHIPRHLPALATALGTQLRARFDEYSDRHPSIPDGPTDARDFLDFLDGSGLEEPPYLRDLIACERLRLELIAPSVEPSPAEAPVPPALAPDDRPSLNPRARLVRFAYDLPKLYPLLARGETVAAPPDPSWVLAGNLRGGGRVRLKRISQPTARLIERCDGRRSVRELASALNPGDGPAEALADCLARLGPLVETRFLLLETATAGVGGRGSRQTEIAEGG